MARDLVRLVQQARREAQLQVSDRIRARIVVGEPLLGALEAWRGYIAAQTLAVELSFEQASD